MVVGEQVHRCLLETLDNSCSDQRIQDRPCPGTWKFSCFEGTCTAGCISQQVYFLCPVFRAFRGKADLGKKGAMHSKWGLHLSHAVSHALYYLAFGECCLAWKRWLVPLQSSQISFCYVAVWWGGVGRKVKSFWAWTNSQFGHMALEDICVQESQRWLGCLGMFLASLLFSSWYIGYT